MFKFLRRKPLIVHDDIYIKTIDPRTDEILKVEFNPDKDRPRALKIERKPNKHIIKVFVREREYSWPPHTWDYWWSYVSCIVDEKPDTHTDEQWNQLSDKLETMPYEQRHAVFLLRTGRPVVNYGDNPSEVGLYERIEQAIEHVKAGDYKLFSNEEAIGKDALQNFKNKLKALTDGMAYLEAVAENSVRSKSSEDFDELLKTVKHIRELEAEVNLRGKILAAASEGYLGGAVERRTKLGRLTPGMIKCGEGGDFSQSYSYVFAPWHEFATK